MSSLGCTIHSIFFEDASIFCNFLIKSVMNQTVDQEFLVFQIFFLCENKRVGRQWWLLRWAKENRLNILNDVTQVLSQCLSKLTKLLELWLFTLPECLTQFLQVYTSYIIFMCNPIKSAAVIFENSYIFMISQRTSLIRQASRGIFEEMKYLELMIVNDHKMVSISIQW